MGLTTEARVRLDGARFLDLLTAGREEWIHLGQLAYRYAHDIYTDEGVEDSPYPDDVSQHLALALAVNNTFLDHRNRRATRAKYWARDFADLIVRNQWDAISVLKGTDDAQADHDG